MSFLGRAIAGGLAGGIMTGSLGGAAGGAAMGGLGWGTLNKFGGGLGAAGYMRKGLNMGVRGMKSARNWAIGGALRNAGGRAGVAFGFGADAAQLGMRGLGTASSFIGRNALRTNRVAGYAAGALGVGSAAYIGSSVLSSNRGY
jgi:hypothetical protein